MGRTQDGTLSLPQHAACHSLAGSPALGRFSVFLSPTRDYHCGSSTATANVYSLDTGVASTCKQQQRMKDGLGERVGLTRMAGGDTLVVSAAETTPTHLITRRTVTITAL